MVLPVHAAADPRFGAQIEGGIGPIYVRPLEVEATPGVSIGATLDRRLAGSARASCELATTAGQDFAGSAPGAADPGVRTLTTLLLGVGTIDPVSLGGHFACFGVGVGYSTLSHAHGSSASGPASDVPPGSTTAFALGAGVGYRFRGGPGAFRFQVALRAHALIDAGAVPANTYSFRLGLAY